MIIWPQCSFRIKKLRMTSAKMLGALRMMMEVHSDGFETAIRNHQKEVGYIEKDNKDLYTALL